MKVNLPLVGSSSPDEDLQWLQVERINLYPESAPDGRSPVVLRTAAGLDRVLSGLAGSVRGMRVMGGILYVVAGERLYAIDEGFNKSALGTVLGGGRCVLTDTFIPDTSRQLIIGTGERGYVYDTVTGFVEITDSNFVARAQKRTPVAVGGYVVWDTPDGALWSAIEDPMTYPALNFRTAETVTDGVVGLALVYGDVWIGGQRSIEAIRLTGDADENAFELAQTIDYGWASPYGVINADNRFFFLESRGRVYVASGFNCTRVSTHQIEQWLSTVDMSDAWMFSFVDRGHEFVGLTIPESKTYCYDIATSVWSRRKSKGIERWQVNAHALFNGDNIFGFYQAGRLARLEPNYVGEGFGAPFHVSSDSELIRELITPYVHEDGDPFFISCLDLVVQGGLAAQTGDGIQTAPVIEMRYLDLYTPNAIWSDWKQASIGAIGAYGTRVRWLRLGRTRQRLFHFRISDPVRCDLITATLTGEVGDQA